MTPSSSKERVGENIYVSHPLRRGNIGLCQWEGIKRSNSNWEKDRSRENGPKRESTGKGKKVTANKNQQIFGEGKISFLEWKEG